MEFFKELFCSAEEVPAESDRNISPNAVIQIYHLDDGPVKRFFKFAGRWILAIAAIIAVSFLLYITFKDLAEPRNIVRLKDKVIYIEQQIPQTPAVPEQPAQPADTQPSTPAQPEPSTPSAPSSPVTPVTPINPVTPSNQSSSSDSGILDTLTGFITPVLDILTNNVVPKIQEFMNMVQNPDPEVIEETVGKARDAVFKVIDESEVLDDETKEIVKNAVDENLSDPVDEKTAVNFVFNLVVYGPQKILKVIEIVASGIANGQFFTQEQVNEIVRTIFTTHS